MRVPVQTFSISISKILYLLALVIMLNSTKFALPSVFFYGVVLAFMFLIFTYNNELRYISYSRSYLIFIMVGLISLLVNEIDPILNAYYKYISFLIVLLLVSPLIYNQRLLEIRGILLDKMLLNCLLIVLASFLGLLVGVIPLHSAQETFGGFRGITNQSMIMAPLASIAFIFSLFHTRKALTRSRKLLYYCFMVICLYVLLIAGSRSALGALLVSVVAFLYIQSGNRITTIFKFLFIGAFFLAVTFPLWSDIAGVILQKSAYATSNSGVFTTRNSLWGNRIMEFLESPVLGIGMNTVDLEKPGSGFKFDNGSIESGSSWLYVLSSMGLVGFFVFLVIYFKNSLSLFFSKKKDSPKALYGALIVFFFFHMLFEGYVFSSGNSLTYILFLLLTQIMVYNRNSLNCYG